MYYKLGLRDAQGLNVAIKWRNGILHKMNANAMKTRLDQTKTRQPDTEGGTVVTRICMTAILSNKVFGLDRQLSLYIECHHHEQVQRIVAHMKKRPDQDQTDRQGRGWHCGHALGSNSLPLLHCITLYQYLAWRVYSLWSVHNHLTGYWFTLTKRVRIPLGKNKQVDLYLHKWRWKTWTCSWKIDDAAFAR